jgi:hypothetical protein
LHVRVQDIVVKSLLQPGNIIRKLGLRCVAKMDQSGPQKTRALETHDLSVDLSLLKELLLRRPQAVPGREVATRLLQAACLSPESPRTFWILNRDQTGTCPKARGTSREDEILSRDLKNCFNLLRSRQYKYKKEHARAQTSFAK